MCSVLDVKGKTIRKRGRRWTVSSSVSCESHRHRFAQAYQLLTPSWIETTDVFVNGKADSFLAAIMPQELRARNIGNVVLSTTANRPWSQYSGCIFADSLEFVRKYPWHEEGAPRLHYRGTNAGGA